MSQDGVTILVGTTKGAFFVSGGKDREGWTVSGPFCGGWPINHVVGDSATGTVWAGGGGEFHGAGVWRSEDLGATWEVAKLTKGQIDDWAANDPQLAAMMNWTEQPLPFADQFSQVWSLAHAHGTLYAGAKPARLLASRDGGKSWEELKGLRDHPSADSWNPGGAGLVLHTIVPDPANAKKLWVGISAAGVFATEDGGRTWDRRNRLSNMGAERRTRPSRGTPRRRNRTLRPQHNAGAGHRRPALPAKSSRGLAFRRRRPKLGRHHARSSLDVRFSDLRSSTRPGNHLDHAFERRHGGPLSARCCRGRVALTRRRRDLAGHARRTAAGSVLLHRSSAGHGA